MNGRKAKALRKLLLPLARQMKAKKMTVLTRHYDANGKVSRLSQEVPVDHQRRVRKAYVKREQLKGIVGKPKRKRDAKV